MKFRCTNETVIYSRSDQINMKSACWLLVVMMVVVVDVYAGSDGPYSNMTGRPTWWSLISIRTTTTTTSILTSTQDQAVRDQDQTGRDQDQDQDQTGWDRDRDQAVLVTTSTHKQFSFIGIWILHCSKCNNAQKHRNRSVKHQASQIYSKVPTV